MGMSLAAWKTPGAERKRLMAMADELRRQAAHIAAAEYRWLRLLAEFDEAGGWVDEGVRSCAAWLSWAVGMSPEVAREKVRVARALTTLPKVSAAYEQGRISYSKVRAITRVANPLNEELLVTYAQSATAAQLEVVLRGYRRSTGAEDAREAGKQIERRWARHWVDEDGNIRISACLPPDSGAVVVAQMERLAENGGEDNALPPAPDDARASAETAERGRGDAPLIQKRWDAPPPSEVRRADALLMMAESAAAHGPKAMIGAGNTPGGLARHR